MVRIDRIARAFTSQLPAGLDPLRNARVFVRRAGPFFSINVIITNVEVHNGSAGDLHTTVHVPLGGESPVQDVVEVTPPDRAPVETAGTAPVASGRTQPATEVPAAPVPAAGASARRTQPAARTRPARTPTALRPRPANGAGRRKRATPRAAEDRQTTAEDPGAQTED